MDIVITGRNMNVTERLEEYVAKKVDKLDRYMANIGEVRVELTEVKASNAEERQVAQVTVRNERGRILRAEERSSDIMAAVDTAVDRMSRQIERYKGKGKRRRRGKGEGLSAEEQIAAFEAELAAEAEEEPEFDVIRRKRFDVTPMNDAEAIDQLELLDHDFYLFYNADTAMVNVVYRRKGGGYGILEPELS
jgi:putative sigma-54 modulation protein